MNRSIKRFVCLAFVVLLSRSLLSSVAYENCRADGFGEPDHIRLSSIADPSNSMTIV